MEQNRSDRREFLRKMLALGVSGHLVLLGGAAYAAADNCTWLDGGDNCAPPDDPDKCTTADPNDDECKTADHDICSATDPDKDPCPGGLAPADQCKDADPDQCPGETSPSDDCPPTGERSKDVCNSGKADADICDPSTDVKSDQCESGSPADDQCPSKKYEDGNKDDYCPTGEAPADECAPNGTDADGDRCQGGDATTNGNTQDTCEQDGSGDNCSPGSWGQEDDCKATQPDVCSAVNPVDDDSCYNGTNSANGSGGDDWCRGDVIASDECPDGSSAADLCTASTGNGAEDACPGGGKDVDTCSPGVSDDTCYGGQADSDECTPPADPDECSVGTTDGDKCTVGASVEDECAPGTPCQDLP